MIAFCAFALDWGEADSRRDCEANQGQLVKVGVGEVRGVSSFTLAKCGSGKGEGERGEAERHWSLRSGYRGRLGAGAGAGDARGEGAGLDGVIEPALLEPPRNEPELSEKLLELDAGGGDPRWIETGPTAVLEARMPPFEGAVPTLA
jgi:hypothetical protein